MHKTIFMKLSGTWLSHGSYRVCTALLGSTWLLWELCRDPFRENCLVWLLRDRLTWRCDCGFTNQKTWGLGSHWLSGYKCFAMGHAHCDKADLNQGPLWLRVKRLIHWAMKVVNWWFKALQNCCLQRSGHHHFWQWHQHTHNSSSV